MNFDELVEIQSLLYGNHRQIISDVSKRYIARIEGGKPIYIDIL